MYIYSQNIAFLPIFDSIILELLLIFLNITQVCIHLLPALK